MTPTEIYYDWLRLMSDEECSSQHEENDTTYICMLASGHSTAHTWADQYGKVRSWIDPVETKAESYGRTIGLEDEVEPIRVDTQTTDLTRDEQIRIAAVSLATKSSRDRPVVCGFKAWIVDLEHYIKTGEL